MDDNISIDIIDNIVGNILFILYMDSNRQTCYNNGILGKMYLSTETAERGG